MLVLLPNSFPKRLTFVILVKLWMLEFIFKIQHSKARNILPLTKIKHSYSPHCTAQNWSQGYLVVRPLWEALSSWDTFRFKNLKQTMPVFCLLCCVHPASGFHPPSPACRLSPLSPLSLHTLQLCPPMCWGQVLVRRRFFSSPLLGGCASRAWLPGLPSLHWNLRFPTALG